MYDAENVEFKFSRLRRHLKLKHKQEQAFMNILYQRKTLCYFPTGFGKSIMYQNLPWLATRISSLVADAQLKAEEMLCESCSQRKGKFHQNGIVLIISHLNGLIDNHIEEAERVNIDAVTRL